jgi:hypothetical protein
MREGEPEIRVPRVAADAQLVHRVASQCQALLSRRCIEEKARVVRAIHHGANLRVEKHPLAQTGNQRGRHLRLDAARQLPAQQRLQRLQLRHQLGAVPGGRRSGRITARIVDIGPQIERPVDGRGGIGDQQLVACCSNVLPIRDRHARRCHRCHHRRIHPDKKSRSLAEAITCGWHFQQQRVRDNDSGTENAAAGRRHRRAEAKGCTRGGGKQLAQTIRRIPGACVKESSQRPKLLQGQKRGVARRAIRERTLHPA